MEGGKIILFLFLISSLLISNVSALNAKELALKTNRLDLLNGDANADGEVNIFDLAAVGVHYGSEEGDENWDWKVDIANTKDEIDIFDLAEVGLNYGKNYKEDINDPVFIHSPVKVVLKNQEFTIYINISTEADIYAVDFKLGFNSSLLEALEKCLSCY